MFVCSFRQPWAQRGETIVVTSSVLGLSILLQFAAAFLALRLITVTRRWRAWSCVAVALVLMGIRRCITMWGLFSGNRATPLDLLTELVALSISVLLVVGIASISPLLKELLQEGLLESEKRFRTLAETIAAFVTVHRGDRILYANKTASLGTGYSRDELRSMRFWEIVSPEQRDLVKQRGIARLQGQATADRYEVEYRKKNGSEGWVDVSATRFTFDGEDAILTTAFDITERKKTEEALRLSEERYSDLVENTSELITQVDADGCFAYVNPVAERVLGVSKDDCIGRQAFDFIHPDDRALTEQWFRTSLADHIRHGRLENRLVNQCTGEVSHFLWTVTFHYDGSGNVTTVSSIAHNITKQKQRQQELQTLADDLDQRIKELNCLYGIAKLVQADDNTLDNILQGAVDLIPPAWQHPEATSAQIILEGRTFCTRGFRRTPWTQSSEIVVCGQPVGRLEVHYLEEKPVCDEGPFLAEERDLLDAVAERLGHIIERMQAEESLQKIEWLLSRSPAQSPSTRNQDNQPYGDLTKLNTCRGILDSVGPEVLAAIVGDFLDLLDTSAAVYEKNGDYAFGTFSSGWCRVLDAASYHCCGTDDPQAALQCGKWHCHESCWTDASRPAVETGQPVDVECRGGLRLYAVPIRAADEIVGSINFGYGDPPSDPQALKEIAAAYHIPEEELLQERRRHDSRPAFLIDLAKRRLASAARFIGEIYQRKQTEVALLRAEQNARESSAFYHSLVDNVPHCVFRKDLGGKFTFVNDRCCEILGRGMSDIIGKTDFDLFPPALANKYTVDDAQVITSGTQMHLIEQNVSFAGSNLWVEVIKTPVTDNAGEIIGLQGIFWDITEQKDARDRLNQFEQIVQSSTDMLALIDRHFHYLIVNDAYAEAFGDDPSEFTNRSVVDLVGQEVFESTVEPHANQCMTGQTVNYQRWLETPGRERRYIDFAFFPYYGEDHEILGFAAWGRDITEVRRSEENLERLFNMTGYMVCIADIDGYFRKINKSFESTLGYSADELLAKPFLDFVHPDDVEATVDVIETELRKGQQVIAFENRYRHSNGLYKYLRWTSTPVVEEGVVVAIAYDVTEQRRAEEEQEKLQAQIQHVQRLESLGVLAGGIAHDFNNLLTIILGNAAVALDGVPFSDPVREDIEQIKISANRAADLCRQMLAFSGRGKFVVQPIDLSDLVAEMGELLKVSISKTVQVEYRLSRSLPAIEADASQVQQIVMNLIVNASDAIGEENGLITVTTGKEQVDQANLAEAVLDDGLPEGNYVFLEVVDTGSGMDQETIQRIFDPFFTTKFTGRGLGLAAVLGIVRGHRGTMTCQSEVGKGTTFRVLFPASTLTATGRRDDEEEGSDWYGSGTILVVDDEEGVLNMARRILEPHGFNVLAAGDGQQAVNTFCEHADEIAAVLLDMTMPVMGGVEAFRELRRIRKDLKIVLCSGYSELESITRLQGEGAVEFLQKPYHGRALLAKLREMLGE